MAVNGHVQIRGEGLNNLVLTCSEDKKVYRLMKRNTLVTHQHANSQEEKVRTEEINEILEYQVAYVENVIRPQILPQFIASHKIVNLPEGFAETVESQIADGRLEVRSKKYDPSESHSTIDPATKSAVMLPDLCFVTDLEKNQCLSVDDPNRPTISVEIKPKKGFMPEEGTLPAESAIKYSVCKFCIHQRLKTKEGRWTQTSHYCPIDLFSGNRPRMKHSLYGLCETPQHNLKVCMNGDEIHGKHVKDKLTDKLKTFFGDTGTNGIKKHLVLSEFLDLVVDALLFVPVMCNGHSSSQQSLHGSLPNQKPNCSENEPSSSVFNTHEPISCLKNNEPSLNSLSVNTSEPSSTKEPSSCSSENKKSSDEPASNEELCSPHCSVSDNQAVRTATLKSFQKCSKSSYVSDVKEDNFLPKNCVLGQILSVQALDTVDIENIYPLFTKVNGHIKTHPSDKVKWNLYGPFTTESWLRPCTEQLSPDADSLEYAVDMVKRFNVSKTLQDCSLMVALQRIESSSEYKGPCLKDAHGRRYMFSVSVIDLDYKPFNKVQKWIDLENEMLNTYNEIESLQQA